MHSKVFFKFGTMKGAMTHVKFILAIFAKESWEGMGYNFAQMKTNGVLVFYI